jgi:hypothetical protein
MDDLPTELLSLADIFLLIFGLKMVGCSRAEWGKALKQYAEEESSDKMTASFDCSKLLLQYGLFE